MLTAPLLAGAHTLKTDGSISVIMHTDPDDDVVAGEPATVYFSVSDAANQFSARDCDCTIQISEAGRLLASEALTPDNTATSIFSYQMPFTFPDRAAYRVILAGEPKSSGQFSRFQIGFDLEVTKAPPVAATPRHAETYVDWIIGILALAGIAVWGLRDKISYNE